MIPFLLENPEVLELGDYVFIPGIRSNILAGQKQMKAYAVKADGRVLPFDTSTGDLTEDEKQILVDGCLINYYRNNT